MKEIHKHFVTAPTLNNLPSHMALQCVKLVILVMAVKKKSKTKIRKKK